MSLAWREDFSIGHPDIDREHKALVDVINTLSLGYCESDLLDTQIKILERYAEVHFSREEAMMREAGYPELDSHQLAHDGFRRMVKAMRKQCADGGEPDLQSRLAAELSEWLKSHILVVDKAYAPHVIAK